MNKIKLILPPHLRPAIKVDMSDDGEFIRVTEEAAEMIKQIEDHSLFPVGSKYNDCFAMAQPQMSDKPLKFFVFNPKWEYLIKEFGGLIVVNPRLISKDRRTRSMNKEGCVSYPFRPEKKVKRFLEIEVEYDIIKDVKGRKYKHITKQLKDLPAIVFQHELEHLAGKSIWAKK